MASLAHKDAQQIRDERLFLREHELEEADLGYFSRELACEVNAVGALDVGGGVLISCRKPAIDPLNDPLRKLSPREYEVLQYVVNGYSNRAIANEIGTLSSTISTQKASMLKKLEVVDEAEAACFIPIDEKQLKNLVRCSSEKNDPDSSVLTPVQSRRMAGAWRSYRTYVDDMAQVAGLVQPQVVEIITEAVKHQPTRIRLSRDIVAKIQNPNLLGELEHTGYAARGTVKKAGVSLNGLVAALLFQRKETAVLMRLPRMRPVIQTIINEEVGLVLDKVYDLLEQRVEV